MMRLPLLSPRILRYAVGLPERRRYSSTIKTSEPLRILFCGSDTFSTTSLLALHTEQTTNPSLISSIDVVCRLPKRTGRGLKVLYEAPIKRLASSLSLPLHELDTFTSWSLPSHINLIIAVSFGLFLPPRILSGAKYGGLNVHPSLLPDFAGPAPVHHVLLAGCTHTGVTLQTLDPHHFDRGTILAQTPDPGFPIPNADRCTLPELLELVALKGADILVEGLREGVHVPPLKDIGRLSNGLEQKIRHAPKITPEDRHVQWSSWPAHELMKRERVLGPLWFTTFSSAKTDDNKGAERRVILHSLTPWRQPEGEIRSAGEPGNLSVACTAEGEDRIVVRCCDDAIVEVGSITVDGAPKMPAIRAARKYHLL